MEDKKNYCPKTEKCPIFIGGVLQRPHSEEVYRKLFCKAGELNYSKCKRLIINTITGKPVPLTVMPNSLKTIEEILISLGYSKEFIDNNINNG